MATTTRGDGRRRSGLRLQSGRHSLSAFRTEPMPGYATTARMARATTPTPMDPANYGYGCSVSTWGSAI
ncbi:MAG: hypothetical protein MZV70_53230 [Desulfobacterales bacterium]|nr:hypothetical protein [Desulfobacterales bacterium]